MAGGKELAGSLKAAGAIADEELDLIVAPAIGDDVGMAVSIEVGDGDAVGMRVRVDVGGGRGGGAEGALAVAEKDRNGGGLVVGDDEVEIAVAVHVGDADVVGVMSA